MKVENGGRISLTGPLSRNDNLKGLSINDTVDVRVIERLSKNSAMIDLKGNKVIANFTAPVPKSDRFPLVLTRVDSNSLTFTTSGTAKNESILKSTIAFDKALQPDGVRAFLNAVKTDIPGLFALSAILSGVKYNSRNMAMKRVMRYLVSKGLNPSSVAVSSAILSGVPEKEIRFIADFFQGDVRDSADKDDARSLNSALLQNDIEFDQDDIYLISGRKNDTSKAFCYFKEGGIFSVEFVSGDQSYAGRIETPSIGTVEFFIRACNDCECVIACHNSEVKEAMESLKKDIFDRISKHYSNVIIKIFTANDIRERVIEFASEIGNKNFNAKA